MYVYADMVELWTSSAHKWWVASINTEGESPQWMIIEKAFDNTPMWIEEEYGRPDSEGIFKNCFKTKTVSLNYWIRSK